MISQRISISFTYNPNMCICSDSNLSLNYQLGLPGHSWPLEGDGGIGFPDQSWETPGDLQIEPGEDLSGV